MESDLMPDETVTGFYRSRPLSECEEGPAKLADSEIDRRIRERIGGRMSEPTYTIHDPDDEVDLTAALQWAALCQESQISIDREAVQRLLALTRVIARTKDRPGPSSQDEILPSELVLPGLRRIKGELEGQAAGERTPPNDDFARMARIVGCAIRFIEAQPERSDGRDVKSSGWYDATLKPGETIPACPSPAFHLPPNAETSISADAVTIRIPIAGTAKPLTLLPSPPGDRTARAAERLADDLRRLQPHP